MAKREYLVGLPVLITVDDDGTVTYQIDTAEAGVAISEIDYTIEQYTDQQIEADAARANADHVRRFGL